MRANVTPWRTLWIAVLAMALGGVMAEVSQGLLWFIEVITSLAFFGRMGVESSPVGNNLGGGVILVPIIGGLIVGLMARFGSPAIRGHGIPEAMEQVLENSSRIPARITWLKPLSAAISIGTGGPFGAEGPIIATGGASGSLLGQILPVSITDPVPIHSGAFPPPPDPKGGRLARPPIPPVTPLCSTKAASVAP